MRINFMNLPPDLRNGVYTLEKYGFFKGRNETICLHAMPGKTMIIEKKGNDIFIAYDKKTQFYMALARSMDFKEDIRQIQSKSVELGFMIDCSRNAVLKPSMIKELICVLALAGYSYLELYTEETYELPEEPYFGYCRGRYSREELMEIIEFANIFGIEVVPCIQTLAHLGNLANWSPYGVHMDIDDILLVGDDRTYQLIRKCFRYCKEVFQTKRINIGCDEAFHLGRGRYTDTYGYKPKHDILIEHLERVFVIAGEEGLEPEFWADGFYHTKEDDGEVKALFDGTQTPIMWCYDCLQKEYYVDMLSKLKGYAGKVQYAAAAWKCIGYAPDNQMSERVMKVAFEAATECGADRILVTTWGDNGAECSVYAVMPALWYAAELIYPCDVDMNGVVKYFTGYTKDEWKMADRLNKVMPQIDKMSSAAKYLLHNDFLIGLMDYNIPDHAGDVYLNLYPEFQNLAQRDSRFSYIFESYEKLCLALTRKSTYGKRLYAAYHGHDRGELEALLRELYEIQEDIQIFYEAFRKQWMIENKGYGFEVMDVRIGGLIKRAETVAIVLRDYIEESTDCIYELEQERMEYFCGRLTGDEVYAPMHAYWATLYTVNHI